MTQEVESFFKIGVSVGVVSAHLHIGKVFLCGVEDAGCECICGGLASGRADAPSVRLRPF